MIVLIQTIVYPGQHLLGRGGIGTRMAPCEFVSADARKHITGAKGRTQRNAGAWQQLIASGIALSVIDRKSAVVGCKQGREDL